MKSLPHSLPPGARVVLYPRVSGPKQVKDGYGLGYQETEMRAAVEEQGVKVVEVVSDPAFERDEWNRPGLDRLRQLASAGKIDYVLAWRRDRYFSGTALRAMFQAEMGEYGVKLLAMDDSGGDRPEDEFSDDIKDAVSKLEVAKTRARTTAGRMQKVREGKIIMPHRINYGFRSNATRDQYEIDEDSAQVVRRIFRMIGTEGYTINRTVRTLNAEGIPSPTGATWSRFMVRKFLLDDLYRPHTLEELRDLGITDQVLATLDPIRRYGVWYYNRRAVKRWREPITYARRTKTTAHPRDEWMPVPVPDIGVPLEHVKAAREAIKNNVKPSRASGRVWELDSGTLRCGACGRAMIPRHTHHDYYACASYSQIPRVCPNIKYHRAEALEAEVVRRLSEWFSDPEATTHFIQERLEAERKKLSSGDPEVQTTALTSRIEKLARMKANYRRQQAEELISLEDLKSVLADLDAKEREARAELDNILNRKERLDELIAESKLILDNFAATAHIGLENLTPAERRDAYKRLHLKVTVEPDDSLTIEGDAGANYLPDVSEISEARRVESKQVDEAIDSLQKGMNNSPLILLTIEPP